MVRLIVTCVVASIASWSPGLIEASAGGIRWSAVDTQGATGRHDSKTTTKYLAAVFDAWRGFDANLRLSDEAISNVVRSANGCRNVASAAPFGKARLSFAVMITNALSAAAVDVDAHIAVSLLARTRDLRWTDHRVTEIVQRVVSMLVLETHIKAPLLCGSLREWAKDAFARIPLRWRAFLHRMVSLSRSGDLLPGFLKRYEYKGKQRAEREIALLQRLVANELIVHVIKAQKTICRLVGMRSYRAGYKRRSQMPDGLDLTVIC